MKLGWAANYSSQSGYSIQSRLFVPRLRALGHDVTVFELAGGTSLPKLLPDGVQVLPTWLDPLGSDILPDHARQKGADAVITLTDTWAFQPSVMEQFNWLPFVPVDHTPCPPAVVEKLKAAVRPIAISQHGVKELRRAGFDPLFIPHGVDPAIWYPGDKREARRALGIEPDLFWVSFVGVNDSNPSRKGIPELLMAWSILAPLHPDWRLYLHTSEHGNLPASATGGVRIDLLVKTLAIDPHSLILVDAYKYKTGIPASDLAQMARASDVLVLPSRGEGVGLPLIEFARVGCPTITTDCAGGAEHCWGGWKIPGEPSWSWQSAFQQKPGIASLVETLEEAYQDRDNPSRSRTQIEGARQHDIDRVISVYAVPALRQIGEMLLDRKVT